MNGPEPDIHPALTILPMMNVADLKSLAENIKANGLREPIHLHQGMVIDGRNRLSACHIAGVEPHYQTAELGTLLPVQYVLQQNLSRRNLTKSQLAAVGALSSELMRTDILQLKRQGKPTPVALGECLRDTLGKALGIPSKTVQDAINIRKENPDLFQRLWAGEISLLAALGRMQTSGPQRHAERIGNHQKRKMIDILSHVRGACRGLAEIDVTLVAMDQEERKAWLSVISQTTQELRQFGQKLKKENHEASHNQIEGN